MTFAPRQNWDVFNKAKLAHQARQQLESGSDDSTDMNAAFMRYADYFDTLRQARQELYRDSPWQLRDAEKARWEEKIALRTKLVALYQAMDRRRDG